MKFIDILHKHICKHYQNGDILNVMDLRPLTEKHGFTKQSISNTMTVFVRSGLVERCKDQKTRRGKCVQYQVVNINAELIRERTVEPVKVTDTGLAMKRLLAWMDGVTRERLHA